MSVEEELRLTPFEKWKYFHKFPWKLTIHLCILALSICQCILPGLQRGPEMIATRMAITDLFLGHKDAVNRVYRGNLLDSASFQQHLLRITAAFFASGHTDTAPLIPAHHIPCVLRNYTTVALDHAVQVAAHRITLTSEHPLGPFDVDDPTALRLVFNHTVSFMPVFMLRKTHFVGSEGVQPVVWKAEMYYDFSFGDSIQYTLNLTHLFDQRAHLIVMNVLSVLLLLCCAIDIILSIRALVRSSALHKYVRRLVFSRMHEGTSMALNSSWDDLPLRVRIRFFNLWVVVSMLSDLINAAACIVVIIVDPDDLMCTLFRGLGTFCALIHLTRYFEYFQKEYMLVLSARRAVVPVFGYVASVVPFLVGYALLGLSLFSLISQQWSGLWSSIQVLFASMVGDSLMSTFHQILPLGPWISRLYFATYMVLFIIIVFNNFRAICEHSFHVVQKAMEGRSDRAYYDEGPFQIVPDRPKPVPPPPLPEGFEGWGLRRRLGVSADRVAAIADAGASADPLPSPSLQSIPTRMDSLADPLLGDERRSVRGTGQDIELEEEGGFEVVEEHGGSDMELQPGTATSCVAPDDVPRGTVLGGAGEDGMTVSPYSPPDVVGEDATLQPPPSTDSVVPSVVRTPSPAPAPPLAAAPAPVGDLLDLSSVEQSSDVVAAARAEHQALDHALEHVRGQLGSMIESMVLRLADSMDGVVHGPAAPS